jgi:hypothetical protein
MSADPTRPLPEWSQAQRPAEPPTFVTRRRRRKGPLIALITVIVLLVLLVVSDRVANAYAENQMASQVQSSLGLSGKPHVTIQGFPFWTQLLAKDFKTVDITASNETINNPNAGGGALEIASLNATLRVCTSKASAATARLSTSSTPSAGHVHRAGTWAHPQGHLSPGAGQGQRHDQPRPLSDTAQAQVPRPVHDQRQGHLAGGSRRTSWGTWPTSASRSRLLRGVDPDISVTQQGVMVTISGTKHHRAGRGS